MPMRAQVLHPTTRLENVEETAPIGGREEGEPVEERERVEEGDGEGKRIRRGKVGEVIVSAILDLVGSLDPHQSGMLHGELQNFKEEIEKWSSSWYYCVFVIPLPIAIILFSLVVAYVCGESDADVAVICVTPYSPWVEVEVTEFFV